MRRFACIKTSLWRSWNPMCAMIANMLPQEDILNLVIVSCSQRSVYTIGKKRRVQHACGGEKLKYFHIPDLVAVSLQFPFPRLNLKKATHLERVGLSAGRSDYRFNRYRKSTHGVQVLETLPCSILELKLSFVGRREFQVLARRAPQFQRLLHLTVEGFDCALHFLNLPEGLQVVLPRLQMLQEVCIVGEACLTERQHEFIKWVCVKCNFKYTKQNGI